MTSPNDTTTSTLSVTATDEPKFNKMSILWIPYFFIAFVFISFLLASFLHYHYKKRGKCRDFSWSNLCERGGCLCCICDLERWGTDRRLRIKRPSPRVEVSTVPVHPTISISMAHSGFSRKEPKQTNAKTYSSVPGMMNSFNFSGRQSQHHKTNNPAEWPSAAKSNDVDAFGQTIG